MRSMPSAIGGISSGRMVDLRSNSCSEHNSTDEELVTLFLESRDNRHFQKLYERYAVKVYQKCVTLTRDATRAEDVMHDVFLKLIHKMGSFKTGAKFSTWLYTITHNHCMDLARGSKRKGHRTHWLSSPRKRGPNSPTHDCPVRSTARSPSIPSESVWSRWIGMTVLV